MEKAEVDRRIMLAYSQWWNDFRLDPEVEYLNQAQEA